MAALPLPLLSASMEHNGLSAIYPSLLSRRNIANLKYGMGAWYILSAQIQLVSEHVSLLPFSRQNRKNGSAIPCSLPRPFELRLNSNISDLIFLVWLLSILFKMLLCSFHGDAASASSLWVDSKSFDCHLMFCCFLTSVSGYFEPRDTHLR